MLSINGGSPVRNAFLPFGAPCLGQEEYDEVLDTLKSGWIGTGPKVQVFEAAFARYIGAPFAIAVSSCTAALHLALIALGIGPGDEVITSPLTFAATANVIIHQGATPVFADVDPATLNLLPSAVAQSITTRTKALLPVHFGGLPCEMQALRALAQQHGLAIVEDAAHAIGARLKGQMIGSSGNPVCFSFYANKNLTTAEGGMITTEDPHIAEQVRIYRLHGMSSDAWRRFAGPELILSDVIYPGFKYNMTDIQASLGIHQLCRQEEFWQRRAAHAAAYDQAFSGFPGIRTQYRPTVEDSRHALHLYVIILDPARFRASRDQIVRALLAENIGVAIHYRALHTHPYYAQRFGYQPDDFPVARGIGDNIFSLPISPGMTSQDVDDVIEATRKVLEAYQC
jgi:dTDP-4-amino-4,6-dideoxygalactose transaminase